MITKTKTSVSLSSALLNELSPFIDGSNVSAFIEKALRHYLYELKRQERGRRDIEIINANAARFNKDAEENLQFQSLI